MVIFGRTNGVVRDQNDNAGDCEHDGEDAQLWKPLLPAQLGGKKRHNNHSGDIGM